MKRLLLLSALIEAPTGLALLAVPAVVVHLLLGADISGASITLGRGERVIGKEKVWRIFFGPTPGPQM